MKVFLYILFAVTLCGDAVFGVSLAAYIWQVIRSNIQFEAIAFQIGLLMLGISLIASAISGFGAAMLRWGEQFRADYRAAHPDVEFVTPKS